MKAIQFVLLCGALLFTATGCSEPCVSGCEAAKDCDGASQDTDCEKSCADSAKLAEDAGCSSEYDDVMSCVSGEDVCDMEAANSACLAEGVAAGVCMAAADG